MQCEMEVLRRSGYRPSGVYGRLSSVRSTCLQRVQRTGTCQETAKKRNLILSAATSPSAPYSLSRRLGLAAGDFHVDSAYPCQCTLHTFIAGLAANLNLSRALASAPGLS
jgi:hypothetical protein